jgi:hypothetical protein
VRAVKVVERELVPSNRGQAAPAWKSLEEELARLAADYPRSAATRRETTTDGAGRYRFADLVDGASYQLQAYKPGYVVSMSGGHQHSVETGATADFRAERVLGVE